MAIIYYDKKGVQRVKGGRHLKGSQSYPLPFLCWEFFSWVLGLVDINQMYDVGEER